MGLTAGRQPLDKTNVDIKVHYRPYGYYFTVIN